MLYRALENPLVYDLSQKLNPFTTAAYRKLALRHVQNRPGVRLLDIGCGTGVHREVFDAVDYTGVDINPDYIAKARSRHSGRFMAMDAGALTFEPNSFDEAIVIATCHHIDDETLHRMAVSALRVVAPGGGVNLIDPIMPLSRTSIVRRAVFRADRGRHQRHLDHLVRVAAQAGRISDLKVLLGPLHDVAGIRITH